MRSTCQLRTLRHLRERSRNSTVPRPSIWSVRCSPSRLRTLVPTFKLSATSGIASWSRTSNSLPREPGTTSLSVCTTHRRRFTSRASTRAISDYLRFADDIGRRAIDADFLSELDPLECTHAQLAATAQWQHLRPLLRAIETRLGERREAFLAWARSVEPSRAEFLVPLADLEKGKA